MESARAVPQKLPFRPLEVSDFAAIISSHEQRVLITHLLFYQPVFKN